MIDEKPFDFEQRDPETPQAVVDLLEAWRWLLKDQRGRHAICDLLKVCHYGVSAFSGKDIDTTNMICGKQKVGEEIMKLTNAADPNAFFKMMQEERERPDDRPNSNTSGDN